MIEREAQSIASPMQAHDIQSRRGEDVHEDCVMFQLIGVIVVSVITGNAAR